MAPDRVTTWGLSGLGPRNAQFLIHLAIVLLANEAQLAELRDSYGIHFLLKFFVFEKQDQPGVGDAFQTTCDATINSPVPGLPDIVGIETVDPTFTAYADLASAVSATLNAGSFDYLAKLEKRNPAAAILFRKALLPNGNLNTSIPCITRGEWGRIQIDNFNKALDYIAANIPALDITVHYFQEVLSTDFSNPKKPALLVKKVGETTRTSYNFDFVTLNNGMPLISPVSAEVAPKAYSLTPNHDTLRAYLTKCGVLCPEGYIIPGKSIAFTGAALSFYDYANLLLPFLPCFRLSDTNPAGFEIDENLAANYQGLITVISHSARRPAPPRTAPDKNWRGARPFLPTREMHAARLQSNYDHLSGAYTFLVASIARSTGKVPTQVDISKSAEQYMAAYYAENNQYLAGEHGAETDLLCTGFTAIAIGAGLEFNPKAAEDEIAKETPCTREGRIGWPFFSAAGVEITSGDMIYTSDNVEFYKVWHLLHLTYAASPVPIQQTVAALFASGIATHVTGKFKDIYISPKSDTVTIDGHEFDALLAPKLIDRDSDPVFHSLVGQVKERFPGVPDYGKGGHYQAPDGKPVHAFDGGIGGRGTTFRDEAGNEHTAGQQWNETNSYSAATTFATNHAQLVLMLSIAPAIDPEASPIETVSRLYEQILPSTKAFDKEVRRFEDTWTEMQTKLCFLRLCERLAGNDAAKYRELTDKAFTTRDRASVLATADAGAQASYNQQLQSLPDFNPPTLKQFEARFAFHTKTQLNAMLTRMFDQISSNAKDMDQDQVSAPKRSVSLCPIAEARRPTNTASPRFPSLCVF
ncbi:hypothetical protein BGZ58_001314 [Dissophora ornata]|nr:hypothetical protein BGZ58_001314 [Dissophora ornata]